MEYWQDLYHELEAQKEKGLDNGFSEEGIFQMVLRRTAILTPNLVEHLLVLQLTGWMIIHFWQN